MYGLADATAAPSHCFITIKIGLTFLVPTYTCCRGKEAVKPVPFLISRFRAALGDRGGATEVKMYCKRCRSRDVVWRGMKCGEYDS